jgi:hypothetical protein
VWSDWWPFHADRHHQLPAEAGAREEAKAAANRHRIVTPAPMKKPLGPVIRLGDASGEIPRIAAPVERSAIAEPKRKPSIFGNAPEDDQ